MMEKTIKKVVFIEGIGIHSGKQGMVRLLPLSPGMGIIFKDIDSNDTLKASVENVTETRRAIILEGGNIKVQTPEHLLSALYVLGITNLLIEFKGEIPILDGSARPFVELISDAGIVEQNRERKVCRIEEPIFIRDQDRLLVGLPSDTLRVRYLIDYPDTYIESEYFDFLFNQKLFVEDISKAKTFSFYEEIEFLRENNLSLGGSLENAIVVKGKEVLGNMTLKREFAKHKIIDFLGDISLLNKFLIGDFILIKTGHTMHIELVKRLMKIGGYHA